MTFATILAAESGSRTNFADLDVPTWAWVGLSIALAIMLAIDLIRHRDAHAPTAREAAIESVIWITCGLAFSILVWIGFGGQAFGEYISGYLIEKSLSVDNVFVWSILFSTMSIPIKYQHRVLFWGIFGALALRLIFILAGTALISKFWQLLVVFGLFLVFSGIKIIRHREDEGEDTSTMGLGLLKKIMPVTDEPFIVFASNAFAILGLRAMYFLLANARERFHYLSHALGGILIFVGLKMTISHWYHLNTYISLGIILLMLAGAVFFSEMKNRQMGDVTDSPVHH